MKRIDSTRSRRFSASVAVGTVLALLLAGVAFAAEELGGKLRTGNSVTVAADETVADNLYAFAGTVSVDGTVDGDVVAAGGNVSIDGIVTGDVLASGGQIQISGEVMGDARLSGGQVSVTGDVGGDVAVVGGDIELAGAVGADVLFGAGQVRLTGEVAGNVFGSSGSYERSGTIGGTEDVAVPQPEPTTFSDQVISVVQRFVALFLVGLVAVFALRRPLEAVLTRARTRPGASLLYGLIFTALLMALLVLLILAGIVVSVVFGLLGLGLLVGTFWFTFVVFWILTGFTVFVLAVYGAPIVAALTGARLLLRNQETAWMRILALALGLIALVIVTAIPVVGWVVGLLAFLYAAGAAVLAVRNFGAGDRPEVTVGKGELPQP